MGGYIMLLLGAVMVLAGAGLAFNSYKVRSWPTVQGTLVERGIQQTETASASRAGSRTEVTATYTYQVDGKTFTGHRVHANTALYSQEDAQAFADALPQSPTVYVNPADPTDALLFPTSYVWAGVAVGGGLLMLLLGLAKVVAPAAS